MAAVTVQTHATKRLVRVQATVTSSDANGTIVVTRNNPNSGATKLRTANGVFVGTSTYAGLVTTGPLPLTGYTPAGSVYTVTVIDPEPVQNVLCTYTVACYSSTGTLLDSGTSAALTVAPDCGGDFLYDMSRFARGRTVNVQEFNELSIGAKSTVALPLGAGNPQVSLDVATLPSFDLKLATLTDAEARELRAMVRFGGPVFALSPANPSYGITSPVYFVVTGITEARASNLANQSARLWTLTCQQVAPPAIYFGTAANAYTVETAINSWYSSYAVEGFGNINDTYGHALSYPTAVGP